MAQRVKDRGSLLPAYLDNCTSAAMQAIQIYNGGFTWVNCRLTIIDNLLRDTLWPLLVFAAFAKELSVEGVLD